MIKINLRGFDAATLSCMQADARRRNVSLNQLIVDIIRQRFSTGAREFDDLDALAGTWTKTEAAAFEAAIAPFAQIGVKRNSSRAARQGRTQ